MRLSFTVEECDGEEWVSILRHFCSLSGFAISDGGTGDFKDPETGGFSPPLTFSFDFISFAISHSLDDSFSLSFSCVDFDSTFGQSTRVSALASFLPKKSQG